MTRDPDATRALRQANAARLPRTAKGKFLPKEPASGELWTDTSNGAWYTPDPPIIGTTCAKCGGIVEDAGFHLCDLCRGDLPMSDDEIVAAIWPDEKPIAMPHLRPSLWLMVLVVAAIAFVLGMIVG